MLEQVHDALWIAEGGLVSFFGAPYPTRSVIARFENGDLWVWSPVKLTADLRSEVDKLGSVRHLVSPNKLHHLYLKEWKAAYPAAKLWGPQTTIKKRPDLEFQNALTDSPPDEWLADIDQAWFRGSFAMDEIVFLHRPSATAIVADLIQTFTEDFLRELGGGGGFWRASMASLKTRPVHRLNGDYPLSTGSQPAERATRCWIGIADKSLWLTVSCHTQTARSFLKNRFAGLALDLNKRAVTCRSTFAATGIHSE